MFCDFSHRLRGHLWERCLCHFLWMVDILNLPAHLSCNVSDDPGRPLRYGSYEPAASLRVLYCLLKYARSFLLFLFFTGKLCLKMAWYFIWPFGKSIEKVIGYLMYDIPLFKCLSDIIFAPFQAGDVVKRSAATLPKFEVIPADGADGAEKDSAPLLMSTPIPVRIAVPEPPAQKTSKHWVKKSLYHLVRLSMCCTNDSTCSLCSVASALMFGCCWASPSWPWSTPWPACSPGCRSSLYLWPR